MPQNSKLPYSMPGVKAPLKTEKGLQKNSLFKLDIEREVNVYDVATKTIVFTGLKADAAKFMGMPPKNVSHIDYVLSRKTVYKKKYAVRFKKTPQTDES